MASQALVVFLLFPFSLLQVVASSSSNGLIFEGFDENSEISLEGSSIIKTSRLLKLTNRSTNIIGHAFYKTPFQMLNKTDPPLEPYAFSFSTYFVFSIVSPSSGSGGFGLAFTIAPSTQFPGAEPGHYLGLFNSTNDGNDSNNIFAVEFDTVNGFKGDSDTEGNHVGVNINGMESRIAEPAAYIKEGTESVKEDFRMAKVDAVQAWIDYDGEKRTLNVTIAPWELSRPSTPLIKNYNVDLSNVMKENMFVGFSASTGQETSSHYLLGWSFAVNGVGVGVAMNLSNLPKPPPKEEDPSPFPWVNVVIGILSALTLSLLCLLILLTCYKRYMDFEVLEDWEMDCPHRFRYKDLHLATKGFKESQLIGIGGFGAVYKGVLPTSGTEVAVKRIMRSPFHGMREFAAEIESLGRLRHKNLVNLQGWCKKKNDLLLVYDFISNGSLDCILYSPNNSFALNWGQRFNILKGISAGLLYLHEEWEQVVIHRDVKTSNILIDGNLSARLGDFGLARLYNHGQVSHTTRVVGTIGYIAPELTRTGKASTRTDVYAFGVVLLEVVTGKRPLDSDQFFLVEWAIENYHLGQILEVVDPKLNSVYDEEEVELVLKLGLLCTQRRSDYRPTMKQVTRYLNFDDPLPDIGDLGYGGSDSSSSSRMNSGFLEVTPSLRTVETSGYLSSITMSTKSLDAGR
ncbi:lectin-domain containing receptor kinase VI.3-like [Vigna radiata var. radiata]|uniref:non-specific serine/threonine protein kinase n=1 Tax=Vigna radiata var. radiata TaxID=3916 RepID=A0A1S3TA72_VIGRR|nr:lectin-domain containing receptor kinase VI.3-like [Vigna radiata var. radiata]